jgi:hypothetical protein
MPGEKKILREPITTEWVILKVLWAAPADHLPLGLSQVYQEIAELREKAGEASPALTTVSNALRNMLAAGFLTEKRRKGAEVTEVRTLRSMYASRSPQTAYAPACEPAEVILPSLLALIDIVPPDKRVAVLVELVKEMKLKKADLEQLHADLPNR